MFESFVTFQEEYYKVYDQVTRHEMMQERHRQRSSTSTIGDEVVRHFALDTLDIAISIINQDHGSRDSITNSTKNPQLVRFSLR